VNPGSERVSPSCRHASLVDTSHRRGAMKGGASHRRSFNAASRGSSPRGARAPRPRISDARRTCICNSSRIYLDASHEARREHAATRATGLRRDGCAPGAGRNRRAWPGADDGPCACASRALRRRRPARRNAHRSLAHSRHDPGAAGRLRAASAACVRRASDRPLDRVRAGDETASAASLHSGAAAPVSDQPDALPRRDGHPKSRRERTAS